MAYKLINTEPLCKWDIMPIVLYLLFTATVFSLAFKDIEPEQTKNLLFFYVFTTPLIIPAFNYKSLRKTYSALIWMTISVVQYFFYQPLTELESLNFINGHAALGLQWIWLFFLAHQLFRLLTIKLTNREYEPIEIAFAGSRFFRGENFSFLSAIFFAVYVIAWMWIRA